MSTEHPLRAARAARGLNQQQLAQLSGVSQPTISRIEAGQYPSLSNALALARVLNMGVEELFGPVAAALSDDVAEAS